MAGIQDMKDFAYRHLRDFVENCHITKVYATASTESFVVVIGNETDSCTAPPMIWRALNPYKVDVKMSSTEEKIPIAEDTFVCYQNGRWIR